MTRQIAVNAPTRMVFALKPNVNELLLLEMLNFPICEVLVAPNLKSQQSVRLQFQSIFDVRVEPLKATIVSGIKRTLGQGCRLYHRVTERKLAAIQSLLTGVIIDVVPADGLFFQSKSKHFQLSTLEDDEHLVVDPKEIAIAKAVLARPFDYTAEPNSTALQLSELAQASLGLKQFASRMNLSYLPDLLTMLTRLQEQLESKRQWLFRHYCTALERSNLAQSANGVEYQEIRRRLAMYEMLVSDELKSLVNMMVGDDSEPASR